MRLKKHEIREYREQQLIKQNGLCPLCNRKIEIHEATLDHSHVTGKVRQVLHRNCNSVEGRILHWARRSGIHPEDFLSNLMVYLTADYSAHPEHPEHKLEHEREITRLRRRMRRLRSSRRRQYYMDKIRELQREHGDN